MTSNSPIRMIFKLTSSVSYNSGTPSYSALFRFNNPQVAYSSAYLCYFRQYTTYTNMAQ